MVVKKDSPVKPAGGDMKAAYKEITGTENLQITRLLMTQLVGATEAFNVRKPLPVGSMDLFHAARNQNAQAIPAVSLLCRMVVAVCMVGYRLAGRLFTGKIRLKLLGSAKKLRQHAVNCVA